MRRAKPLVIPAQAPAYDADIMLGGATLTTRQANAPVSTRVMNLATLLTQTARRLPDHLSLVWGDHRWTWSGTEARVRALTAGLATQGVGKGTVVLVHSRNSNELFELMFALFRLGAIFAPTNFRLTPSEVADLADLSGATIFCCQSDFPDPCGGSLAGDAGPEGHHPMGAGTSGQRQLRAGLAGRSDRGASRQPCPALPGRPG